MIFRRQSASSRSNIGINLAAPADWGSELAFVDLFRTARPWISQRNGGSWGSGPALQLDTFGNVKKLSTNCYAETLLCTLEGGIYPSGRYVCSWTGAGTVTVSNAGTVLSSSSNQLLVNVDSSRGPIHLQLRTTNPLNPVRDIRFVPEGTAPGANPFRSAFLNRWSGMRVMRFMDWQLTNNSLVSAWSSRPNPADATWQRKGIPLETIADLCNQLQIDPWICIPHKATDDFVRQTGVLLRQRLDPARKVYVEYSNELWNGGFDQTAYCEAKGMAMRLHPQPWEAGWRYASLRSVQVFLRFQEGFLDRARTVRIMGTQAANPYIGEVKLAFRNAFQQTDALAIAPYLTLNVEPDQAAAVVAGGVSGVLDYLETTALAEVTQWMADHKALATRFGKRLVAYEAGQHAVGIWGAEWNDALTSVLTGANRHARMGALYTTYLNRWRDVAGGDICCLFSSCGEWSGFGSWGLIEHETDDTPKFAAVRAWMAANPVP